MVSQGLGLTVLPASAVPYYNSKPDDQDSGI